MYWPLFSHVDGSASNATDASHADGQLLPESLKARLAHVTLLTHSLSLALGRARLCAPCALHARCIWGKSRRYSHTATLVDDKVIVTHGSVTRTIPSPSAVLSFSPVPHRMAKARSTMTTFCCQPLPCDSYANPHTQNTHTTHRDDTMLLGHVAAREQLLLRARRQWPAMAR